ncbi:MAG: metalloregulator ArsR/SmtB family transcription factor [Polyangiaceae bacterium]
MVELSSPSLDRLFHAMAQPTRRAILEQLSHGDRTVSELAEPIDSSLAAVSKHIHVLEEADLVQQTKVGRTRVCSLRRESFDEMAEVIAYYQSFWTGVLDNLERALADRSPRRKK